MLNPGGRAVKQTLCACQRVIDPPGSRPGDPGPLHHVDDAEQRRPPAGDRVDQLLRPWPGRAPARRSRWPCCPGARRGRWPRPAGRTRRPARRRATGTSPSPRGSRRARSSAAWIWAHGRVRVGLRPHDDAGLGPGGVVVRVRRRARYGRSRRRRAWGRRSRYGPSAPVATWAANDPNPDPRPGDEDDHDGRRRRHEPPEPPWPVAHPGGTRHRPSASSSTNAVTMPTWSGSSLPVPATTRYASTVAPSSSAGPEPVGPALPGPQRRARRTPPRRPGTAPSAPSCRSGRAAARGGRRRRGRAARPPTCGRRAGLQRRPGLRPPAGAEDDLVPSSLR